MSPQLISRNLDLLRLQEDGFDVAIVANHLVVRNVPFVTRGCTIAHGMMVSTISLSGYRTQRPAAHVAMFAGALPCDSQGRPLATIINSSSAQSLGGGLLLNPNFSGKPNVGQ